MFKTFKEDLKVNDYRITPIFILLVYRTCNKIYYSKMNKFIKKIILVFMKIFQKLFVDILFGVEIHCEARIGKGLRIVHPRCIVISSSAVLGENCTIFHETTIGVNEHKKDLRAATIGNNVYIGTGGKIIGNVSIADNCRIGANAVVTKDMPENSTVVCEQKYIVK